MNTTTVTRLLEFDAGHRLLNHESKCAHAHGHRYRAEVTCTAPNLDKVGRVIDFGVIKQHLGQWIDDNWDHAFLVNRDDDITLEYLRRTGQRHWPVEGEPSAEILARVLFFKALELLSGHGVTVTSVKLWETPNCFAEVKS
jgi:6-pyruvoyltetrahydropterin/6-carboxytetrahydropterin synthase